METHSVVTSSWMPPRFRPAASPGLPPAGIVDPDKARNAHRNKYPARRGAISPERQELVIKTTLAMMEDHSPREIAVVVEQSPEAIKRVIKAARQKLQMAAETYVDMHLAAAGIAATAGDAKPAQWALERIQEGEQRVVEREKAGPGQPSIQIGIAVGGIPQPRQLTTPITPAQLAAAITVPQADLP